MSEFGKFKPEIKTEEFLEDKREKEKREVEMIEKSPLEYQDKMELALLYLGEKPAIWIDTPTSHRVFYKSEKKREEIKIFNKLSAEKENLEQVLKDLKLVYEFQKNEIDDEKTYGIEYSFLVAKNSENLSRLKDAIQIEDGKETGLILGYPKTAVEAFDSNNTLDYKKLPKEEIEKLIEEGTSKFLDFHLSKDHWQEELNLVKRHQALIKEKFPNLYKEIIKYGVDQIKINEPEKEDSEKQSSITKVIGNVDKSKKEKIRKEYAERFADQKWEEFEEKEIEKSPGVIKVINFVNEETNKLLKYYGLEKFDIKSNNVHLFYQDTFEELIPAGKTIKENADAFCSLQNQAVCFNTDQVHNKIDFAVRLFHEDCHLKARQVVRAYNDREGNIARAGITFISKEKTIRLLNLYEGLIEELTKIFYHKIVKKSPLFKEDIEKLEELKNSTENETIKASDEIYDYQDNEWREFGYSKQRKILNALIEKLYFKNKDEFKDKEEVFDLFAKSVFTGKLNWGKLVNKTFGRGTFKKLTQLDENIDELEKFVQELK